MEENTMMETMETTEVTTVNDDCETTETGTSSGWIVKAVGVIAVGAAVIGVRKCKGLIEKQTIKRLEKKGYTVTKPEEPTEEEPVEAEVVSEEDIPEEEE